MTVHTLCRQGQIDEISPAEAVMLIHSRPDYFGLRGSAGEATAVLPQQQAPAGWRTTRATFYGPPYDSHPSRYRCADGTPYRPDGLFCATRLVPIGTVIEVRRGTRTLTLTVRDTQARRFGHLIDIPSKTWDTLGAKRSIGMLDVQWRVTR
jgi:hypothetical protein